MENPIIEWYQISQKKCLKFTFDGQLREENAVSAIEKRKKFFASKPDEKIVIVWDCLKMSGYDSGARNQWQNALKQMANQIEIIWLISNSNLIKMGASVMSLFASYKMRVIHSEKEIDLK